MKILIYLNIIFLAKFTEQARILCIFLVPFYSSQSVFRVLIEDLASQGHEMTVFTALPSQKPADNVTEIDVQRVSFASWDEVYNKAARHRKTLAIRDITAFWNMSATIMVPIYDHLFGHPRMQSLIKDKSQHFDLILMDACSSFGSILRLRFNVPIVLMSSMTASASAFGLVGAETNVFLYPDFNILKTWNLSFWQKIRSLYQLWKLKVTASGANKLNSVVKKHFGPQIPSFSELNKGVAMLFVNVHRFWDNNRPVPIGALLHLGGLHLKSPKSLPEDIKKFVDNSTNGVVIMSLGSKLKSSMLPARTLRVLVEVFSKLPYDVIWKHDSDMPNKPSNVRLEKWLPQNDLLHHPNVKAFITHGGLQSTDEAIEAGVPLIGLPVHLDQWLNTDHYEKHGIGVRLDIDELQEDEFRNAILAVAERKLYRENVARVRAVMSEQRPLGRRAAARWVAHLIKHGSHHIRSPRTDATITEFYMLDLMLITVVGLIMLFVLVGYLLKRFTYFIGRVTDTRGPSQVAIAKRLRDRFATKYMD